MIQQNPFIRSRRLCGMIQVGLITLPHKTIENKG
jgi:hypothetical protein